MYTIYYVHTVLIIVSSLDERATLLTKNGTNPYFISTVARVQGSQVRVSLPHLLRVSVDLRIARLQQKGKPT